MKKKNKDAISFALTLDLKYLRVKNLNELILEDGKSDPKTSQKTSVTISLINRNREDDKEIHYISATIL